MSISQATGHPVRSSRRKRVIVLALLVASCILAWQIKRLCVEYYSPENDPEQVAARKEEEEEEKERRLDEQDNLSGSYGEVRHALAPAANEIVKLGGTCSFKDGGKGGRLHWLQDRLIAVARSRQGFEGSPCVSSHEEV